MIAAEERRKTENGKRKTEERKTKTGQSTDAELKMLMRLLRALVLLVLALVVAGAVTIWYIQRNGFSARAKPGPIETAVALRLRSFTIPSADRARTNPLQPTADHTREGMEHFADHCAVCHANDGSGSTEIGGGLYPKPPDLKQERTQSLTDGELFHIIQNGVRFTGMPAFAGDDEEKDEKPADKEGHGEQDSWRLVLFVRHLPKITPAELTAMKKLNPKAPDEMAEQPGHAEPKRPAGPAHKHGRS